MWDPMEGPWVKLRWNETVRPDGREPIKINYLNLTSVNGTILNLKIKENKKLVDLASIYYSTVMMK